MTVIIAYKEHGKVYMGGDAGATSGSSTRASKLEKVFTIGDEFLIGYTSSFRMGQIIEHCFKPPNYKEGASIQKYLVSSFVPKLTAVLENHNFLVFKDNEAIGGTFLLGFKGKIFEIGSDMQVNEFKENYHAVGSGERYALGALHAMSHDSKIVPKERLTAAFEASAHFTNSVCGPFTIKSVDAGVTTKK